MHVCLVKVKRIIFSFENKKRKVFVFNWNMKTWLTELVFVILGEEVEIIERGKGLRRKNWTRSRMRWKSHVRFCRVAVRMTYLSTFPLLPLKNQTLRYVKLPEYA